MKQHTRWKDLFSHLIKTPSVSSVKPELDAGNNAVSDILANELERLGLRVSTQQVPGHAPKSNVIASIGPGGAGGLLLAGHSDTVPFDQDRWATDPFTVSEQDGRLFGLGACDMKGFFVAVIEALSELNLKTLNKPLTIIGTADEESGMAGAKMLSQLGTIKADYGIIGEPTSNQPIRMHKGIFMEGIRYIGQSGHSSNPANGRSALEGMHALVGALMHYREQLKTHTCGDFAVQHPTINFGSIAGGDNPNRICAECEIQLDARVIPGITIDEIRTQIQSIAKSVAHKHRLEAEFVTLFDGIDAMETKATSPIVKCCERLSQNRASSVDFATEGPFLTALGVETVIMGPGDIATAHQPNEYVDVEELMTCKNHIKSLIHEFCGARE